MDSNVRTGSSPVSRTNMWRFGEIGSTRHIQNVVEKSVSDRDRETTKIKNNKKLNMSAFEHVPYFLKCPNCGKVHLYEHIIGRVDKMPTDIECPTCGTLMNYNNSVDIKADSWFSYT